MKHGIKKWLEKEIARIEENRICISKCYLLIVFKSIKKVEKKYRSSVRIINNSSK